MTTCEPTVLLKVQKEGYAADDKVLDVELKSTFRFLLGAGFRKFELPDSKIRIDQKRELERGF